MTSTKSKKSKTVIKAESTETSMFYDDVLWIWQDHEQKKKGNASLKETAAGMLALNTEYKMRRIIQEGLKFAMHSKRPGALTAEDIRSALRIEGVEPVYGHIPILGGKGESKVVRLADLKAPQRPGLITIGRHWLAIEGVQPMVPQNPPVEAIAAVSSAAVPLAVRVQKGASGSLEEPMAEPPAKVQKTSEASEEESVMCVLTEELSTLYEKICASITGSGHLDEEVVKSLFISSATQQILPYLIQFIVGEVKRGGLHNVTERCKIVALLGSIVCPEVSLSTSAIFAPSLSQISLLSSSSSSTLTSSVSYPVAASTAVQDTREHFYIEPYLYQLVQIAIACITTKDTREERDTCKCPALAARKDASLILCSLCRRGYTYEGQVVSKVVTALAHVSESGAKSLLGRFGAISALSLLGDDVFTGCGMNGARDVADACAEDKDLSVSVKEMILKELQECVQKSLSHTTNEEERKQLEELEEFIRGKIDGLDQKPELDAMPAAN